MNDPLKILLVEDSEADAALIEQHLKSSGLAGACRRVATPQAMLAALQDDAWDAVIADYSLPQSGALDALTLLKQTGRDLPFIVVSGALGEENAVQTIRAGAHDYVMKDNLSRLAPAVVRELREATGRHSRRQTERRLIESEERYRRFLKMSAEGIYRLEFAAPIPAHLEERFQAEMILQTARVSECNDAFARHYGYTRAEEMTRTPLSDIWSGSLEDRITPLIRFVLSGHRLFEFETSEKDREGRTLFFQNNLIADINDKLRQLKT